VSPLEIAALVALGFAVGGYSTIIGAGGGFILVPVILIVYPDYDPEEVTSISLAVVLATSISGSIGYARQGRTDYLTAVIFSAAAAPGVILGAFVVGLIPERLFTGIFGAMLFGLAVLSARRLPAAIREPLRGRWVVRRELEDREGRTYIYAYRLWQGMLLALCVGFIASLFGIGGGIIFVPMMAVFLHIPVQFAVATSLLITTFMSGSASGIHLATGTFGGDQAVTAVALAAGSIPGGQIGALLSTRLKGRGVLLLLSAAIVILGARLLLKAVADV